MTGRVWSRSRIFSLQVPVGSLFATGSAVIILRMLLEDLLEIPRQLNPGLSFYENLVDLTHVFLCWWLVVLSFAILIAAVFRHPLRHVLSAMVLGLPLILVVPLFDSIVSGGSGYLIQYQYDLTQIGTVFLHLINPLKSITGITPGIRLEIILVLIGIAAYGKLVLHASWARTVIALLCLMVLIVIWGFLPAFYLQGFGPESFMAQQTGAMEHSRMLLIPFLLVMLFLGIQLVSEDRHNGALLRTMLYPSRLVAYGSAYISGYILTRLQMQPEPVLFPLMEVLRVGSGLVGVWLLFLSAKFENDITDLPADRISNPERPLVTGELSMEFVSQSAGILWITSLLFMLPVAPNILLFWLAFASIAHLYVSRHLNIRRVYPLGQASIAVLVITLVLAGAETAGENMSAMILLNHTPLVLSIFMLAFLLANLKDFRDMDGDRIAGYASLPQLVTDWTTSARILSNLIAVVILVMAILTAIPLLPVILLLAVYLTVSLWILRGEPNLRHMDRLILCALGAILACIAVFVIDRTF